jgi:hypothetical protein
LRDKRDVRVAVAGIVVKYALYGRDLSNEVVYIGREVDDGGYVAFHSCESWKRFVNQGSFDYLVIEGKIPGTDRPRRELAWVRSDDAVEQVALNGDGTATFAIRDRLDSAQCA